ncbi:WW domain [Macleaya cordata]|uniref:WW domain n=1 Tax=Macleaya cordata TaxID=56857 RepID=A0A200QNR4_MACCD|nr:WW domain [Macleaya cordata]
MERLNDSGQCSFGSANIGHEAFSSQVMASPAWLSQDVQSPMPGATQQAQVLGPLPPVSGPSTTLASPTAVTPAPVAGSSTPKGSSGTPSDAKQESPQAKFVPAPGYVVPAPSFSYNVVSKANTTSGSSQQSSAAPVIKSNVPASVAALQPPVPSQTTTTGPSFSYNIMTHNTTAPSGSLQFQPSTNTSVAASQEARTTTSASPGSQTVPLPVHPSSSSTTATPNLYPSPMWMPTASSFHGHPAMPGTPGTPGPPGIPPSPSPSSITIRSVAMDSSSSAHLRPVMPSTAPIPSNPAVQQQLYSPYTSLPAMAPPPQALWLQPPPLGGLQRPPFLPYPAVLPGPFPLPVRGMNFSSATFPDSQPLGVTPLGPPGGISLSSVGPGQSMSSLGMQPELPPPGIDQNMQANGDGGTVNTDEVDAWTAHKTDTGAVYYYNAVTGESTYEKPSGFKGEPGKVTVQPTPVSWEKLAGTDWSLVTTDDGKKYYYNNKTKVSSWQIPNEVTELRKKQDVDTLKTNLLSTQNANAPEKGSGPINLSAPAVNTGGRDATSLRPCAPASSSALDLIKKKLQDSGFPAPASPLQASSGPTTSDINGSRAVDATVKGNLGENSKDKQKDANGDENMSDSSSDSEDVDSGPSKEECITQFKEMLKERGILPFSKWEKELPKIVFDPRFKAVPGYSTRRSLFEHYVRTRAEEERKEKRAAQKAAIEGFKQLLEEASEDIDHKADYQSFKKKWGNDPRFEALDRKERELLLNERVLPLKKAAEEKIRSVREAAASSFKSMLREKGDIDTSTRWSRVKDSLRNDPRYRSVKHEDREILFNDYISELKSAEEEAERTSKAKREEQDKLKERERETRKRKEREEQEMERVRLKVRRKEAVSSYQALLVETIRDPQASWTESRPKLEKDPQGRAINPDLDKADTEKLFREHVKILYERCAREFQALLAEVLTAEASEQVTEDGKTVLTSWSAAKRLLKSDPRYSKMPRKERESLWRRYAEDMERKQKVGSDSKEDKLNTDTKSRSSLDSRRSPGGSRRIHGRS